MPQMVLRFFSLFSWKSSRSLKIEGIETEMARRLERRQKPVWQKVRKPFPKPTKEKSKGKAKSSKNK
jgi:hypothetical protein